MRSGRHDLHTLTGSYALDALEGTELDKFERHLRRCQPCEAEVRGLRETAAWLAVVTARRPPARTRDLFHTVGQTRQLPPVSGERGRPWLPAWVTWACQRNKTRRRPA